VGPPNCCKGVEVAPRVTGPFSPVGPRRGESAFFEMPEFPSQGVDRGRARGLLAPPVPLFARNERDLPASGTSPTCFWGLYGRGRHLYHVRDGSSSCDVVRPRIQTGRLLCNRSAGSRPSPVEISMARLCFDNLRGRFGSYRNCPRKPQSVVRDLCQRDQRGDCAGDGQLLAGRRLHPLSCSSTLLALQLAPATIVGEPLSEVR
jgi:hypothetical protein